MVADPMGQPDKPIYELVWRGQIELGGFGAAASVSLDQAIQPLLKNPEVAAPGGRLILNLGNSPIRPRHTDLLRRVFRLLSKATGPGGLSFAGVVCGPSSYGILSEMRLGWGSADNPRVKCFPKRSDLFRHLDADSIAKPAGRGLRAQLAKELRLAEELMTDESLRVRVGFGAVSWLGLVLSYGRDLVAGTGQAARQSILTDLRHCELTWSLMEDPSLSERIAGDLSDSGLPGLVIYLAREADLVLARSFCDWVGTRHGGNAIAVSTLGSACSLLGVDPDKAGAICEALLQKARETPSPLDTDSHYFGRRGDRCLFLADDRAMVRRMEGVWSRQSYIETIRELEQHPVLSQRERALTDIRHCDNVLNEDEMKKLVSVYERARDVAELRADVPLAIICRADQFKPLARSLGPAFLDRRHVRLFQNVSLACAWMGIDPDAVILALDRLAILEANSSD